MKIKSYLALLILLASIPTFAFAEDPKRGLLPDGRAFRVDENGNELVDYIAELEVDVDNLRRRINGCEDQLREREGTVARLSGGKASTDIEERDLGSRSSPQQKQPKVSCPECEDCNALSSGYEQKIRKLNSEAAELKTQCDASIKAVSAKSASDNSCTNTISELRAALKQSQQDWERLNSDSEKRVASLTQDLKSAKIEAANARVKSDQADTLNSRVADLEDRLQRQGEELVRTRDQLASTKSELETSRTRLASISSTSNYREVSSEQPLRATSFVPLSSAPSSQARERVVTDLRGKLHQDLERTKAAVRARDEAFSSFQQRGSITIHPTKMISARGETVDSIKKELDSATTVRELLLLRQDISEINRKATEDIAIVKRMKK